MKTRTFVAASDAINRYGDRFEASGLWGMLWRHCLSGVPSNVSHDATQLIGWTYPVSLVFDPSNTRLISHWQIAESDDEKSQLIDQFYRFLSHRLFEEHGEEISDLKDLLADSLISDGQALENECIALYEDGLAERAVPELFSARDSDGLVELRQLIPLGAGVYEYNGFAVFAHEMFRRSGNRHNSLNTPFLKGLAHLAEQGKFPKIALDSNIIGLPSTYHERMELQYWWGPQFSDDLTNIQTGTTRHGANEVDELFFGIYATDFRWAEYSGQKVCEIEEIRNRPITIANEVLFPCRYIHSIIDSGTGNIQHLDGAIRGYSEESILERKEVHLGRAGRNTQYTKLWRIDGNIDVVSWKSIISDYYRDNTLIGEYFGADIESENGNAINITPIEHEQDSNNPSLEDVIPYAIDRGAGVRISLTCFQNTSDIPDVRSVLSLDTIHTNNDSYQIVEDDILELRKIINRLGGHLNLPTDAYYLATEDLYVNLPLIVHPAQDTDSEIRLTIDALRQMISAWEAEGHDRVISFNLQYPIGGKSLLMSVLGQVNDLSAWIMNFNYPPTHEDEIGRWVSSLAEYQSVTFQETQPHAPLDKILRKSGVLLAERTPLDPSISIETSPNGQGEFTIGLPHEQVYLSQALEHANLFVARMCIIRESVCSNCGGEYRECECSKLLDGITQQVQDFIPIVLFWTDRPA